MADITGGKWNKDLPSASSSIALGDNDIRSNNSSLQDGIEEEHYFSTSSASAGIHKVGSARLYTMAATSELSNPTGDGNARIAHVVADNSLWVADGSNSTWTLVTSNLNLASVNTWTALNEFSSGLSYAGTLKGSGSMTINSTASFGGKITASGGLQGEIGAVSASAATFAAIAGTTGDFSSTLSVDGLARTSEIISDSVITGLTIDATNGTYHFGDGGTTAISKAAANHIKTNNDIFESSGLSCSVLTMKTFLMSQALSVGTTHDIGSISAGGGLGGPIDVPGAAVGDCVIMNQPQQADNAGLVCTGYVSGADVVTYTVWNHQASPVNPGSHTYRATVIKFI